LESDAARLTSLGMVVIFLSYPKREVFMNQFETLYQKAISDSTFLDLLATDTASALQSIGIDPTPEIVSSVQTVLSSIVALNNELAPPNITSAAAPFVS